jgi:hypothetical protein
MSGIITWTPGMKLEDIERQVIQTAYAFYGKNKTATSNALGIAIRTLDAKLEKYESDDAAIRTRQDADRQRERDFLLRSRGIHQSTRSPGGIVSGEDNASVSARLRVESPQEAPAKPIVPMQERKEVQKMLSGQDRPSGPHKGR